MNFAHLKQHVRVKTDSKLKTKMMFFNCKAAALVSGWKSKHPQLIFAKNMVLFLAFGCCKISKSIKQRRLIGSLTCVFPPQNRWPEGENQILRRFWFVRLTVSLAWHFSCVCVNLRWKIATEKLDIDYPAVCFLLQREHAGQNPEPECHCVTMPQYFTGAKEKGKERWRIGWPTMPVRIFNFISKSTYKNSVVGGWVPSSTAITTCLKSLRFSFEAFFSTKKGRQDTW